MDRSHYHPDMTPAEALQLLDQLTAQVSLTRQQHDQVRQALSVLQEVVLQSRQSLAIVDTPEVGEG